MARTTNKLTATGIKHLGPGKHYDGGGLFLDVKDNGSKYWRLKYRFQGKENVAALGVYPDVSLKQARERREEAKKLIAQGIDPNQAKKQAELAQKESSAISFEGQAREWYEKQKDQWSSEKHAKQVIRSLEKDIFPAFSSRPISEISRAEVLHAIQSIEDRGAVEIATRTLQRVNSVFDYALTKGLIENNPANGLSKALKKRTKGEYDYIPIEEMPNFLKALDEYQGDRQTILATKLLMHTFLRTGELRLGRWEEIDFKNALWTIPAKRMKIKRDHLIPLSRQSLEILHQLYELTGTSPLLFPNRSNFHKPMSDNTINAAIKRIGFKATGHGFRKTASTTLNELGHNPDAIERQLSHLQNNRIRGVYNKAEYIDQRRKLMQTWSGILIELMNSLHSTTLEKYRV